MLLRVKIAYEAFGATNRIGTFADGLFMSLDGFLPRGEPKGPREIALVLHEFDRKGRHRRTTIDWYGAKLDAEVSARVKTEAERLLTKLGETRFEDIEIAPFKTRVDGIFHGLRRRPWVLPPFFEYRLLPFDLWFGWPFDGTYDT